MKNQKYRNTFIIGNIALLVMVLFIGCERDQTQKLDERNWELTWSDEFDGVAGSLPDNTKWTFDLGTGQNGWGNQELQNYTDSPDNISHDGEGNLVITAISSGNGFTSARIKTQGLFEQQYGRFEARIITPYGPGLWPAFWMLGNDVETNGWPHCGEIDIMELRGQQPHIIHGSLHGPGYSGGNPISKSYGLPDDRFDADYHLFAIEWDENSIDFFVDDYLYQRVERTDVPGEWVYDHPFFLILNVAVGGNYVGFPTSQTPFPQKMIVDYVRVYKEVK
jgi:beta-glucanase (GH16 family)